MGREKIKNYIQEYQREVVFGAIIFLVASLSFGLGYLANREYNHAAIIIEECHNTSSSS